MQHPPRHAPLLPFVPTTTNDAVKTATAGSVKNPVVVYLGAQAIRSAIRGQYPPPDDAQAFRTQESLTGWRQGLISNITIPNVLVFYLAVLLGFRAKLATEHV
jgi:hypothetical protein